MTEELHDPNVFLIASPAWALWKDRSYAYITTEQYGPCLLIFSDDHLAEIGRDEFGFVGAEIKKLDTPLLLIDSLADALVSGVAYVGLDVSRKYSKGTFERVSVLLARLRLRRNG